MPKEAAQAETSGPAGWSGKMSPELLAPTKVRTSGRSSTKQSKSSARKLPLFLSLNMDGQQPDASPMWEENGALRGEYSMHSFGERPQRRKRIALVCDFGGLTAPEILFERKGVPGYSPPSGAPWQTFTSPVEGGSDAASCCIPINDKATRCNGGGQPGTMTEPETAWALERTGTPAQPSPLEIDTPFSWPVENHPQDSRVKLSEDGVVQTLSGKMGTGGAMSL